MKLANKRHSHEEDKIEIEISKTLILFVKIYVRVTLNFLNDVNKWIKMKNLTFIDDFDIYYNIYSPII